MKHICPVCDRMFEDDRHDKYVKPCSAICLRSFEEQKKVRNALYPNIRTNSKPRWHKYK